MASEAKNLKQEIEYLKKRLEHSKQEKKTLVEEVTALLGKVGEAAKRRKEAEEALRKAHDELEMQVQERTRELAKANETLKADITERKQAEEALRESEEKYRSLVEHANDGITIIQDSVVKFANTRLVEMWGGTVEEVLETPFANHIHPDQLPAMVERYQQRIAGEDIPPMYETVLLRSDGSKVYVEISAGVIAYLGKPADLVMVRDITERKQVEEALRESEARYRSLVESSDDPIYIIGRNLKYLFANEKLLSRFGKSLDEVVGQEYIKFHSPEKTKEYFTMAEKVFESGKPVTYEHKSQRDGRDFLRTLSPVMDSETGKTIAITVISKDITELKQVVEELKSAHEYARNLIDSSLDMIIAVDKERRIGEFNKAAQETFGYTKAEVLGKHIDILYANPAEGLKTHTFTRRTGRFSAEIMNKRKNGELFPAFLSASILHDKRGAFLGIMGVSRDITKLKQSEKERENLQAQLLQSQKVEAIGKLASGIAHDFNNLLTIILGYSQLASARLEEGNPIRKDIEKIKGAGERAAILTRQLLIFSRKQVLKPKVLDLNVIVTDVEKMLGQLIGEDIELITVLESELNQVKADQGQIEQVLINLVVNARDAMPEGGRIRIQTQNVTIDKDICKTIPGSVPGKFVQLTVEDTGIGMDEDILSHIIEPFFTTKKEGTGLGLAVVYGIVKWHNGWINVFSEPARGSTFKVYLPAFLAALEEEAEKAVSIETLRGNGERILLVEDEEDVRQFAATVLREYGYIVFEVACGKDAQRFFENENGNFDLVFSDVVLPDKTGLQLVDEMLLVKPDLRVLLSSGYSDHKSRWSEIKKRRLRFLQKPYAVTDLLKSIKGAIQKEVG